MKKELKLSKIGLDQLYKSMGFSNEELDPDKAAEIAAERARKETLEKIARKKATDQAYLDSLCNYDEQVFETGSIRESIIEARKELNKLHKKYIDVYKKLDTKVKELQTKCSHGKVIERKTSYSDEYGTWHDGPMERKCIECFLVEQDDYEDHYCGLAKSKVVILRTEKDGETYILEFDDLKW
jgi:hypothetical protein